MGLGAVNAAPCVHGRRKRGTRRHNDWSSRQYHKKCWKEMLRSQYVSALPGWASLVR